MPQGWLYALNSGEILHAKYVSPAVIRRNYFKSVLGVKDISGPFGHLISTADGGVHEDDVASCHCGDPCN